ncbi:MAG TPA: hypothetical protein VNO79_14490 [Actinomycetota bacterium]|nr:hypothetical protein [Actinomycetota bacterium]
MMHPPVLPDPERRRVARQVLFDQVLAWVAVAGVVLPAVWALLGGWAGSGAAEPSPSPPPLPALEDPSPSPSPAYLERATPEIRARMREVLHHAVVRVRAGAWEEAEEIGKAQDAARTAGCEWVVLVFPYAARDPAAKAQVAETLLALQRTHDAVHGTAFLRRDVPTTPDIQHAWRGGRVVHDVVPRRAVVFLGVRCRAEGTP